MEAAGNGVGLQLFDMAVVGGGPAGTSAAITAAQLGHRVVLLEAGGFPRQKVCGEFVSAEALRLLQCLLGSGALVQSSPRIAKARLFVDDRVITIPIEPAAASLSRHDLDLALWNSAVGTGVCCRDRTRVTSISRVFRGSFLLQLTEGQLLARAVINATGRWSNLNGPDVAHLEHRHWIGLKRHFFEESPASSCDLFFFDGGYCGVQPVGPHLVNASAMVRAELARNLESVFAHHEVLFKRSRMWAPATKLVSTAPLLFRQPKTSEHDVLFCGDAAAFIDPFSGDGISMALHSGRLAAAALGRHLEGRCSLHSAAEEYARAYRNLLQPTLKNAARLRRITNLPRPLRGIAWSLLNAPRIARYAVHQTRVRA